ncbi:putative exosome-associated protein 4 [Trypanosoma cruzi]|uniref:Exosome-associated protein 4, putative n=2 Tax=Trypanosoma cruzi TaxID=5693 RepID=Q4CYY1_TRYCC|nr:exosome-associated protein 4, putative [Trypanosoma cruzi]EAN85485.1 exosome-associated protein 4, putative [Trypanosoma cruzi]PWV04327.1 putative exosome-associated protein 4 [Trypanosoma cruzi]RNC60646.1 exosome-associated protein 4 [Trypanosoma cruzi]|eukprot:XP_807336.1 exosome-associated protein 4 [Trypanosoma cruzi strain CL Brener]
MKRNGGRETPDGVRYPHIALDVLGQCHSSACVELGNTRVICAVHHPQQLVDEYRGSRGRVACTVRRSASAGSHSAGSAQPSVVTPEKDMSLALEGVAEEVVILEKIPQLLVEVVVEILAEDGGVWDAVATSMSAALVSGGFEMHDLFSACGSALLSDGAVVLDPDAAEESNAQASALVCVMLNSGEICYARHQGSCEPGTVLELVSSAMKGCLSRKSAITTQLINHPIL